MISASEKMISDSKKEVLSLSGKDIKTFFVT